MTPAQAQRAMRTLEDQLGPRNVGEAMRVCLGLAPSDEAWDKLFAHEAKRCLALYEEHYAEHTKPITIAVSRGQISSSREFTIAMIGMLQGLTLARVIRDERA